MNAHLIRHGSTWMGFAIAAVVLVASLASVMAKPAIIKTKDGHTYEGDVIERGGSVTVTIRGVETTLDRGDIDSITYQAATFREQFDERRAKLDASDVAGRIVLARFALENKAYDLAAEIADEAVFLDSRNEEATALREIIRSQARVDRAKADSAAQNHAAPEPPTTSPAPGPMIERRYLSTGDIQLIRQSELKAGDSARVSIPNDVRRSFAAKSGLSFAQFNDKSQIDQALAILADGDVELMKKLKVSTDPDAIVEFKRIQPTIISGCASLSCHGGPNGGGLILFPPESDPATYSNFYILSRYSQKLGDAGKGFFGGPAERKMIDRGRGDQSILVQFGIPPLKATVRHPRVGNYNGIFRDIDDPHCKRVIEWMDKVLKPIEPDYHAIEYRIPKVEPAPPPSTTTAPTTVPAASTRPAGGKSVNRVGH